MPVGADLCCRALHSKRGTHGDRSAPHSADRKGVRIPMIQETVSAVVALAIALRLRRQGTRRKAEAGESNQIRRSVEWGFAVVTLPLLGYLGIMRYAHGLGVPLRDRGDTDACAHADRALREPDRDHWQRHPRRRAPVSGTPSCCVHACERRASSCSLRERGERLRLGFDLSHRCRTGPSHHLGCRG